MLPVIGGETLPGTSLTLCPHSTYFIRIYHKLGFHCDVFDLSQLPFDLNLVFEVGKTLGGDGGGGVDKN